MHNTNQSHNYSDCLGCHEMISKGMCNEKQCTLKDKLGLPCMKWGTEDLVTVYSVLD